MNQQELRATSVIGLLYLIRMLGLFMVLPVLPLIAPGLVGATPLLIGLALGIHGLSQSLLQIPLGILSDRWGRKPLLLAGLLLLILGSLVAALSTDIYGLIIGRFLQGCGAISSVLLALLSDLIRVNQRTKAMTIIGLAIGGSFGMALVLGPLIAASQGLRGIFLTTGFLGLAGLLLVLKLVPTPGRHPGTHPDTSASPARLASVIADSDLWRINASIFLLHFLLLSSFMAFPLVLKATGQIEDSQHFIYYLIMLAGSFVLMSPLMWLADRLDVRPMMLGMLLLLAAGFGLMMTQDAWHIWWLPLIGIFLFFMGFNLLEVLLPAQLSKLAPAGARGASMGVYTTCQFLGVFVGGLAGGWLVVGEGLVSAADIATLLCVNIALCGLWGLLIFTLPSLRHIGNRTLEYGNADFRSAQEGVEGLLSIPGVIDAVIIEGDRQEGQQKSLVYLKVDERFFDDTRLKFTVEGGNSPSRQTGDKHGARDK